MAHTQTRQLKTKNNKSPTRKSSRALAECHKMIALQNSHLNRKKLLSSGRELPSKIEWQHLAQLCEISYNAYSIAEQKLLRFETVLETKLKNLKNKYRREPHKLKNDGDYYSTDQQLRKIRQNYKATKELLEQHKQLYKRSTSYEWKPRVEVEKPL